MKGRNIVTLILSAILISSSFCDEQPEFLQMLESDVASEPFSYEEYEQMKAFLLTASSDDPTPITPDAKPSTFDNLFSSFMKMTNQWTRIVDAFKTTRTSTIKQTLIGKGFDYFNQSSQIQISKGIKEEYFDKYLSWVQARIKVPAERQQDVNGSLEPAKWGDSTMWLASNILFSLNDGGSVKYASIVCARNEEKGTYDFVFSDVKSDFMLAPDVLVISKQLSVLGGIWQDTGEERVKVPKSLTAEDITTVMSFFQIVVFKGFADQFGIKLEFPKF